MNHDLLNAAIEAATQQYWTFPTSFTDIGEAYRDKYGDRKWIGKLATSLTGKLPASQTGLIKGSEEYKRANREYQTARRQIERHVSGQYQNFSPKASEKLKEIGRTLEPIKKDVPKEGLTFTIEFHAPEDKGHRPRERKMTVHMDHSQATQYINQDQPQYSDLFDEWFDYGGETYGEEGDYEAEVDTVTIR